MERKTRRKYILERHNIKQIEPELEGNIKEFNCIECGENFLMRKSFVPSYKGDIICYECADAEVIEQLTYGFYMRFCHNHANLCDSCQDRLHSYLFENSYLILNNDVKVTLILDVFDELRVPRVSFTLGFLRENVITPVEFTPCQDCSKEIFETIYNASELTFGNQDYEPPVELWRRWEINDELTAQFVEKKKEKNLKPLQIYANSDALIIRSSKNW